MTASQARVASRVLVRNSTVLMLRSAYVRPLLLSSKTTPAVPDQKLVSAVAIVALTLAAAGRCAVRFHLGLPLEN
jgi:hypothetical protein